MGRPMHPSETFVRPPGEVGMRVGVRAHLLDVLDPKRPSFQQFAHRAENNAISKGGGSVRNGRPRLGHATAEVWNPLCLSHMLNVSRSPDP